MGRPFHCDFSNALRQAGRSEAEINTPAHRHYRGGDRLGGGAFRKGESVVNHAFEGRSRSPIGNSGERPMSANEMVRPCSGPARNRGSWSSGLVRAVTATDAHQKLIFNFWRGLASSVLQRNYRSDSTLVDRSGCAGPSQREVRERGRGIGS
jgi:hypothetical protein